jgi:hypothetical protein
MFSVCHNYPFILMFQMLATSFGHNRPTSGQYLQKLDGVMLHATAFLSFHKYWPDDGLFRPKIVANI